MKKCLIVSLLIISAIFISFNLHAQVKISNHDDYFSGGSGGGGDEQNVIKIGFFHLFDGEFPVFYERRINNHITVQGGAGVTFFDAIMLIGDAVNNVNSGPDGTPPGFSLGYTLKLGARYYPAGEAPEGFYLSPELRYKIYNYSYSNLMDSNYSTSTFNGKASYFDFLGLLGYQFIAENNMAIDMYAGFGGRVRNRDLLNEGTSPTGANYYFFAKQSDLVPYVSVGFTIGFAF